VGGKGGEVGRGLFANGKGHSITVAFYLVAKDIVAVAKDIVVNLVAKDIVSRLPFRV
jgi:hypothetical protein